MKLVSFVAKAFYVWGTADRVQASLEHKTGSTQGFIFSELTDSRKTQSGLGLVFRLTNLLQRWSNKGVAFFD